MSKVITFSRVFPSYHPKAGQPTHFVEKIWQSIGLPGHEYTSKFETIPGDFKSSIAWGYRMPDGPKHHTIRGINPKSKNPRIWKVGDYFSPRVWSGKPYNSKQIQFAPDIQVKKVWDFDAEGTDFYLSGKHELTHPEGFDFSEVEKNDGLSNGDLIDWICLSPDFKKQKNKFSGQIICWSDSIDY